MKKVILLTVVSFLFPAIYDVGEVVSTSDQNIEKSTCFAGNGYEVNDNWSLSDWNGDVNQGTYNVIFMEMSATW